MVWGEGIASAQCDGAMERGDGISSGEMVPWREISHGSTQHTFSNKSQVVLQMLQLIVSVAMFTSSRGHKDTIDHMETMGWMFQ